MTTDTSSLDRIAYPRTRLRSRRRVAADIDRLLADLRARATKGLHLGAGRSRLAGLISCDLYSPDADVRADATDLRMFENGSIDLIESHHMIEHLSFENTERALREWRRVLHDRGLIALTFPDLRAIAIRYLAYSLAYPVFPRQEKLDYIVKMLVGSQEHQGMFHQNAFDLRRMSSILVRHAFRVEFTYYPYPRRPTPSRLVIARKASS